MNGNKIILDLCGEKKEFRIWYDKKGYAQIFINGKDTKLHVYIWELANGPKPKGYDIHHKDLNKGNYELSNLELLTYSDHRRVHAGWIKNNGAWTHKPCNRCKNVLPLNKFYHVQTRKIETSLCKKCHNEVITERINNSNEEQKEKRRLYKREYYRSHYGKKKMVAV